MKLVVAIVRPEKLNDILEALYRAEVRGLTISRVRGHGGETEEVETYRGVTVKVELHDKVRLEIGVSDNFVDPTVRAILSGGATGYDMLTNYVATANVTTSPCLRRFA